MEVRVLRVPAIVGLFGAVLISAFTSASTRAQADFRGLGGLLGEGSIHSSASAVNADGSVVVGDSAGPNGGFEPFRWTERHGMQSLGALPSGAFSGAATAVSADGQVIVGHITTADGPRMMRWTAAGGMETFGYFVPGAGWPQWASGVSADGSVIVGVLQGGTGFRWTAELGFQTLHNVPGNLYFCAVYGVSADGASVVGSGNNDALLWTASGGTQALAAFPYGSLRESLAVSADGSTIVGSVRRLYGSACGAYIESGFIWTAHGGAQNLGILPTQFYPSVVRPYAANGDGTVVVGICENEPFLWTPQRGMRPLREVLTTDYGLDLSGWSGLVASGLSADGNVIVGSGTNPQGQQEAWRARIAAPAPCADVSGDGVVDFQDINAVLAQWLNMCP